MSSGDVVDKCPHERLVQWWGVQGMDWSEAVRMSVATLVNITPRSGGDFSRMTVSAGDGGVMVFFSAEQLQAADEHLDDWEGEQ